ncbi:sulfatase [bacterium]|nr:sulfatase [bacterium]
MARLFLGLAFVASGALLMNPAIGRSAPPNVVVILIDDVGWGEIGFQGNKQIPTPHMDSIAANGVRCTNGYVSGPYCSPTRAGLMTGRYQTRFGHEFNTITKGSGLSPKEITFADRMKAAGYTTAAIGKWHLGELPPFHPLQRGFDNFYGTLANTPFFHPTKFVDSRISPDVRPIEDNGFYTTEKYAERAVEFLEESKNKPFFLYLPFNAQHAPLQALPKYMSRFPNIADPKRKTFAAMMSALDDAVGRVLEKIRAIGQEENTLIFFTADNGGPTASTTSNNGPLRGFKATTWEGGVRVPTAIQWKGHIAAGQTYDHPIIQLDYLPTVMAAAGIPVQPQDKIEGVNLLPYLTGKDPGKPHETLYWRFGDQWAIRHGDFKLVVGRGGSGEPELYNLRNDLSESKNLASTDKEKVAELKNLWNKWDADNIPSASPKDDRVGTGAVKKARRRQNSKPSP